jgi:hypothetical protein
MKNAWYAGLSLLGDVTSASWWVSIVAMMTSWCVVPSGLR